MRNDRYFVANVMMGVSFWEKNKIQNKSKKGGIGGPAVKGGKLNLSKMKMNKNGFFFARILILFLNQLSFSFPFFLYSHATCLPFSFIIPRFLCLLSRDFFFPLM